MRSNELNRDIALLLERIQSRESAMIENTISLSNINSGSFNLNGVKHVQNELARLFGELSEEYEEIPLDNFERMTNSGAIERIELAPAQVFRSRPQAPLQILCTGHSDTVFPESSAFQECWFDGELLRGPGVADMKGGLMVLLEALRALDASSFKNAFGFTVLISPDEEIGSLCSAKLLERFAKEAHYGLTYEPALADGTLAGARKGSGNFALSASGKSVHAGREFFSGKNAVTAIARCALALEALTEKEQGITVNIGELVGGGPVNIVPDSAVCRFNVRIESSENQLEIQQKIEQIIARVVHETQCEIQLQGGFNRPPKAMTPKQEQMFLLLKDCGKDLGLDIQWRATGGCCEGNNLAAAGLLNIDTLGVRGANIHSDKEYACVDSFVERAQLSALLITRLIDSNLRN